MNKLFFFVIIICFLVCVILGGCHLLVLEDYIFKLTLASCRHLWRCRGKQADMHTSDCSATIDVNSFGF